MTIIVVKIMAMNIIIMMSIRRFIVMTISLYEYCHRDDDIDRIKYRRRFLSDYCHRDDDRVEYRRQWVWLQVFQADQILLW